MAEGAPVSDERVAAGYDAVYAAIPNSAAFARIWREHALGPGYPAGFEHISFITLAELRQVAEALALSSGALLADLGCGMGGPGLWIAREAGAHVIGIDISSVALAHATARARRLGLADRARYQHGAFAATGLDTASVDGAITVDAFQYAPDKQAALDEIARILKPGARLALVCFELDPERVAGLPVFGDDPVDDYSLLLERAGFAVESYAETPGWRDRVTSAYSACVAARGELAAEMGEAPVAALLSEMQLTLQLQPYRRRVMALAVRR